MRSLLATILCLCAITAAAAQAPYPTQPIRMIIPFAPGGPNDQLARPLADRLGAILGQPIVIENRPGANGIIGAGVVANAAPDGHTMLFMTGALTANASIVAKLPFDPLKDFAPITQIARTYGMMLVARSDFAARDLAAFVAMAKRQPGKFTYGNAGVGNPTHVGIELLKAEAGIDILSVPYKGTGETIPALLGGQVDLIGSSTTAGAAYIHSGEMRALGISGEQRAPNLPEVPTFAEQGYPEAKLIAFYGMWFPAGVPAERVARVQRAVSQALDTPAMQRVLETSGLQRVGSTPEEFAAFLETDIVYQAKVNKRIGLSPK